MLSRADIDRISDETTEIISNRVRTVALGAGGIAWAFLIRDVPQGAPVVEPIHLYVAIVFALLAIVFDYLQYLFKYRALDVLRRRLQKADVEQSSTRSAEQKTLIATCGDVDLRLTKSNPGLPSIEQRTVDWDERMFSHRVANILFFWKQLSIIISTFWLLVGLFRTLILSVKL